MCARVCVYVDICICLCVCMFLCICVCDVCVRVYMHMCARELAPVQSTSVNVDALTQKKFVRVCVCV